MLPQGTSERRLLLVVLAGALLLRLGLLLPAWGNPAALTEPDSSTYLAVADGFPRSVGLDPGPWLDMSLLRTPAYPTFIALLEPVTAGSLSGLALVQVLLSTGTVVLAAALGALLLPGRGWLVAAGVAAFDPAVHAYSSVVLSETLFAFLTAAAITAVVLTVRSPSWGRGLAAGLLVAAAVLTRPVAVALPVVLVPMLWWLLRRSAGRWQVGVTVVAFTVAAVVPVGLWTARNVVVADVAGVSTIDALSLYYYRAAGAVAAEDGRELVAVQDDFAEDERRHLGTDPTPAERHRYQRERGVELLLSHPMGAARTWAVGTVRLLTGPARSTLAARLCDDQVSCAWRARPVLAVEVTLLVAMLLAAVVGSVIAIQKRGGLLVVAVVTFVLVALSAGPEAYARFRVPVTPLLGVLAGAGVVHSLASRSTAGRGSRS